MLVVVSDSICDCVSVCDPSICVAVYVYMTAARSLCRTLYFSVCLCLSVCMVVTMWLCLYVFCDPMYVPW